MTKRNQGTGNLPQEITSFVGRRQATADVRDALSRSRLVTLTGPGGVGKSRLALRVVRGVQRAFPDGVFLIELAKLRDATLVTEAVATALNLRDPSPGGLELTLVRYLSHKRLLLLLDNCEHVLAACCQLIDAVLSAAPGVRVLATSRERLAAEGELLWPVPPLSVLADGEEPAHRSNRLPETVSLFEERAVAVVPGFTVGPHNRTAVTRICQRLDGLPLAIELAAVSLRTLSVEQILARLEDRFTLLTSGTRTALPRHQTLRAATDWSFELCTEQERAVWRRCSVFAGDFDLDAAEAVCTGDPLTRDDVFDGVVGLVQKSILVRNEHNHQRDRTARYRMLETIRQYGAEQLTKVESVTAVRRRHRDYYLGLVERAEADWFGPRQPEWLNRVRPEHPNIWTALEFCLSEPREARSGLRMTAALWWYWTTDAIRDGRHWLDRALVCSGEPSPERGKALWVEGWIASAQGDFKQAHAMLDECCTLARQLGDQTMLGYALQFIGMTNWLQNALPEAADSFEQALAHYRNTLVVDSLTTCVFGFLGMTSALRGDLEHAAALCQEGLAISEAHGELWSRSWTLWQLAFAQWRQGAVRDAERNLREALRLKQILNDWMGSAFVVEVLAWVAATDGDSERAAVIFGVSEKLWEPLGGGTLSGWHMMLTWRYHSIERTRAALGPNAFEAACRRGREFSLEDAITYAYGHELPKATSTQPGPTGGAAPTLLTRREREVAQLVAAGRSNRDIAAELVISPRTAETHVEHILIKLGFNSRTQIATWITSGHSSEDPGAVRPAQRPAERSRSAR